MKKKIITISLLLLAVAGIGFTLASNKAKIDAAAKPVKSNRVVPVKVHEASIDSFDASFTINGATLPDKEVKLASEVQGKLVNLLISNGDQVGAGQVIAVLDGSVLHAQLSSVDASLAKAQMDIHRYKKLVDMGGATPMQVESSQLQYNSWLAERKQILEQLSHMQIRAPYSGRVENVVVEKGSFVSYGTILAQLLDNSSLKINVYLSEQQAFKVKEGQQVRITSAILRNPIAGKVNMISDKADDSGKFLAEISFVSQKNDKLKAGILADVYFPMTIQERGLSVPVSALVGGSGEPKVYVVKNDKVETRVIKTGIVTPDKIQVTEGLQAGDKVVTSGQMNLEEGAAVSIN